MNIVIVTLMRIVALFSLIVAYILLGVVRACIIIFEAIDAARHKKKIRHSR